MPYDEKKEDKQDTSILKLRKSYQKMAIAVHDTRKAQKLLTSNVEILAEKVHNVDMNVMRNTTIGKGLKSVGLVLLSSALALIANLLIESGKQGKHNVQQNPPSEYSGIRGDNRNHLLLSKHRKS